MKYRDYVRSLPCCVTGITGDCVDPHHIIGSSWLTRKGIGKKGSDLTCIPLAHELHMELHNSGWRSFEQKYNMSQIEMVIQTILKAEADGII
jgi:hypothetical protein